MFATADRRKLKMTNVVGSYRMRELGKHDGIIVSNIMIRKRAEDYISAEEMHKVAKE
jgi:hypothetical protein